MCDADLIGKKLTGRNATLDLSLYASFYAGEKVTVQKASEIISHCLQEGASINLVGENTLKAACEFVDISKARRIGSVPHLQVYKV